MCGIAGELNFKHTVAPDVLEKMLSSIRRRGPDHAAVYVEDSVGFAHARLAIIDLSADGNQPMRDVELGLTLVFNGVIYNYRELRVDLMQRGYRFFSSGDSEVILKAYHFWGEDCVTQLEGVFAFSIWDSGAKKLFLGRDRFGIKPLYYTLTDEYFRFASTVQALLDAGGVDTSFDTCALHHHLTLHAVVPAPRTLFKGVKKLEPAHSMTVTRDAKLSKRRYWTLTAGQVPVKSEQEWMHQLEVELTAAIKLRFEVSDVPVGVLLSGGLDSSLLVALLRHAGAQDINTYTIGFDDYGEQSGREFEYADLVAQRFETNHHSIHISDKKLFECLPDVVENMAEPMVSQDSAGFYLLAQQVSNDIKVVQTGQGADEVFGGYFWYKQMGLSNGKMIDRFKPYYFDRTHQEFLEGVTPQYHTDDKTTDLITTLLEWNHANLNYTDDFVNTVLAMDATTLIVDDPVKRVDNMTMAWGLEARVPFLDRKLVEFAASMPSHFKIRSNGKYLLKKLARDLLPHTIIDRPKAYFAVPALHYVHGDFYQLAQDILNSTSCMSRGLFDRAYIKKLLANPAQYVTPLKGSKLWHYTVLELWLQRHLN